MAKALVVALYAGIELATILTSNQHVGFVDVIPKKVNKRNSSNTLEKNIKLIFLFSPEFLRESKALKDNLYPPRIIVGCEKGKKKKH